MTKITHAEMIATLRNAHNGHRRAAAVLPFTPRVRAILLSVLAGCALFVGAQRSAHAGPPQQQPPQMMEQDQGSRIARVPGRTDREMLRSDLSIMGREDMDARRRAELMQDRGNADAVRRNSRMTPEERRDLRRQIDQVGQDIYRR